MSAEVFVKALRREQPAHRGFPDGARSYLIWLGAVAAAAAVAMSAARPNGVRWIDFVVLLLVASAVQSFAAHTAGNQVFHAGLAFTVAAALMLPPEFVVVVCVAQHLPEWARQRYTWYIQTFNIFNYVVSALVAWATWNALSGGADLADTSPARAVAAAAGAGVAFVGVNHALLARMLMLARGRKVGSTGLFSADGLITDLVLAGIGISFAFAIRTDPWLAPVAVLPIVLIQRALVASSLREQAYKDHKTGLLNSRGIERAAEEELARARRFSRPISLLMCDIDGLRRINNDHGHLAGDAALVALAETFCSELREYDLCGRFGGDEFVVLLPETDLDEALTVAARVQRALEQRFVTTGRGELPIRVSIGAATQHDEATLTDLIARADAAMYEAKRSGGAAVRAPA